MRLLLVIISTLMLFSCAARPSSIQPAAVSRAPYIEMSCSNLEMQLDAEVSNLENLSGEQISARNWDIALNLLIIPGVGELTSDVEGDIAQSKGRLVVMRDEYSTRCGENLN